MGRNVENTESKSKTEILTRHFFLKGVVQGVGFRPFVYGLAVRLGLKGWVNNSSDGVHIEVEGEKGAVEGFTRDLPAQAPPRSRIESISCEDLEAKGFDAFRIRESAAEEGRYQLVSADIATCAACRGEIFNPGDRRYGYPFTNCTNCGPRFTIIEDIPYDRPRTTMSKFEMCPQCRREYEDPFDRRFHAQPNACPVCGPRLALVDGKGADLGGGDPVWAAAGVLRQGKILAIKGLGGFLLACDARDSAAVLRLRNRKRRPDKPFAVMLRDLDEVREHCDISREEEKLLLSPESPIVLVRWKESSSISRSVAPRQKYLGVMVPYTPLHHLLMENAGLPLVMTSGNLSEEPIARENEEALSRLAGIADVFLMHNRDIYVQYDDSVAVSVNGSPAIIRRARGYAPFPIRLPFRAKPILACGAELKNTFCLTRDQYGFVSQHIGDLENLETLTHYQRTIGLYQRLFRIRPELVAYDLHPEYLATKYALSLPGEKVGVQHHFAHLVSCLADNGERGPAIGITFDGLGFGTDGRLWGGEFLVGDVEGFERRAHFEYVPMPGAAAAIRNPRRMALSYIYSLLGREGLTQYLSISHEDEESVRILLQQIDKGINAPFTSSCGRLFDGVSALLGICGQTSYEGQAAVELEMMSDPSQEGDYPFTVQEDGIIRLAPLFSEILRDRQQGLNRSAIAAKFHNSIVKMSIEVCRRIQRAGGPKKVALSGGVFQNRLLTGRMKTDLENAGFEVLVHREVPCNDGGLSLGQAVAANFIH